MKIKPLEEIASFLAPVADEVGVEIVEVKWNDRERALTVFIDAPGGVDLLLCEKFHRAVDGPLDELDPTFGAAYTLNCSSAGLDRPFKTKRDFERHYGERVEIRLYAPIGGAKNWEGELLFFDGALVRVKTEQGEMEFPVEKIAKACLAIEI